MGGGERISLTVNRSRQILHPKILTTARKNAKPHEKYDFVQHRPKDAFVNGESNHPDTEPV
ncbi:MAG: hypothetical protein ABR611_05790 [Chthoniobacterales bacterium]